MIVRLVDIKAAFAGPRETTDSPRALALTASTATAVDTCLTERLSVGVCSY